MTLDQYRTLRDAGQCTGTRGCERPRVPGRQRCAFHIELQRTRSLAWRARANRKAIEKQRRDGWKAAGLCSKCGNVPVKLLKQCRKCREGKCASAKAHGWYTVRKR